MQTLGEFKLPHFFNYPPYFTLQPVRDTREKQIQLWKELILDYCRTQKIFVVGLDEDFPLFSNPVIERSLSHEAREAFLSALVAEGRAEWLDKSHKKILILWHSIKDWADLIISFVKDNGLEDGVMTVEEIRSGVESRGTAGQMNQSMFEVITRGILPHHLASRNGPYYSNASPQTPGTQREACTLQRNFS
ncbi:vacuolar protein sorting-associated protein 25 isoform X1 [Sesamum indicum]|uniref:Vacuolar protein sorting-associated protein 25 isoform X1 n=1 Tax=Sesamum indicum TaxID=4182 RepID=A0A6I9SWI1_SESIN|nr:vacuolar protein sorting-associated protein 25 isoform X1 [Sesamum indicum]XP_011074671.1 vacuolar protein sorting-associated protein 25 isoform X1 [Sesamum indicum]XP_011074688.1 vacuolar protein sorting-associated protein 25 isoform X1 [Sesamum indicum]XP_020550574.1 vacuolar protein sorting-associated protein 25 isoform X1 [Sesamum indicum]